MGGCFSYPLLAKEGTAVISRAVSSIEPVIRVVGRMNVILDEGNQDEMHPIIALVEGVLRRNDVFFYPESILDVELVEPDDLNSCQIQRD